MYSSYYDRYKDVFTREEYASIESNLSPFVANFGYPVIQKGELDGWFVFLNGNSSPIMYCYDIANLDGGFGDAYRAAKPSFADVSERFSCCMA